MRKVWLYIQVIVYTFSGINHFWHPMIYEQIIPSWLPYPGILVAVSGVCEIALGLLLVPRATRSLAAWGIILLLIAIFPANIQMSLDYLHRHNPYAWLTILRLPLQLVLIRWAHLYTNRRQAGKHRPSPSV